VRRGTDPRAQRGAGRHAGGKERACAAVVSASSSPHPPPPPPASPCGDAVLRRGVRARAHAPLRRAARRRCARRDACAAANRRPGARRAGRCG
jgi:hypothetical protein